MELSPEILNYIDRHEQEAIDVLVRLAKIPAPSNQEGQRVEFCKTWLEDQGAEGVFVDDAGNVIYPIGCEGDKPIMAFMAHSDVVFPDLEELPLRIEDGKIYCPGIGDDTANVVALLMAAKYIAENHLQPTSCGLLLVVNAGEEGLGNLKGARKIIEAYGSRIKEFVTFDSANDHGVNRAVGSRRYQVEVDTEGGHSLANFGNRNAIVYLSSMINSLYTFKVPEKGKSTYNVGTISGGTSVNTIAQHAQMLYEFRSDEKESLDLMEQHFRACISYYEAKGVKVTVTQVGDRPCGIPVEQKTEQALMDRVAAAYENCFGTPLLYGPGSTDCNIPLSKGIASVCVGCCVGTGAHTREEWIYKDSVRPGVKLVYSLILHHI